MKVIVWKWKPNVQDYAGKDVVGIRVVPLRDPLLMGRDGWVGYEEDIPNYKEDEK